MDRPTGPLADRPPMIDAPTLAFLTSEWIDLDRRVRVVFDGQVVADTIAPRLLCQHGFLPVYAFPAADVRLDLLEPSDHRTRSPYKGEAHYAHVIGRDRRAESAAWTYPEPRAGSPDTRGYWSFDFHSMDGWFEEDEELKVHARDPYVRVDAVPSSRHVQILIDGELVADTERPVLTFETSLVTRFYVPRLDVRNDLLVTSETFSLCPYKGRARYVSAVVGGVLHPDVAWYYPAPLRNVQELAGHLAFWGESPATTIVVDDVVQPPLPERSSGDGGELLKPARRFFRLAPPAAMAGSEVRQHDRARPNGRAEGPPVRLIEMAVERAGGRPEDWYPGPSTFGDPPADPAPHGLTNAAAFVHGGAPRIAEPPLDPHAAHRTPSPVFLEPSARRVRALLDGVVVVDSTEVALLFEVGRPPVYAFPADCFDEGAIVAGETLGETPHAGSFRRFGVRVGSRTVDDAAYRYLADPAGAPGLVDRVLLEWDAMDAWFEEDEEVLDHARDPYHRVDVLDSSREIVIELGGVELARSTRPRLVFETDLPTRYYLPRLDVRADLRPSPTGTSCAIKGAASSFSVVLGDEVHEDIVWSYPLPTAECTTLQGLLCFATERVRTTVDGVLQVRAPRPPG